MDINEIKIFGAEFSHVRRRLIHVLGSIVPLIYLVGLLDWFELQVFVALCAVGAGVLEFVRLKIGYKFLNSLYREYEEDYIAGYAIAAFGMLVSVIAFVPEIAVVSILMLTVCDPISGLLSARELRKIKTPRILAVMFLACFVVGAVTTTLSPKVDIALVSIALGAVGATVADGYKLRIKSYVIDDNLTIPLYAGALITCVELVILG